MSKGDLASHSVKTDRTTVEPSSETDYCSSHYLDLLRREGAQTLGPSLPKLEQPARAHQRGSPEQMPSGRGAGLSCSGFQLGPLRCSLVLELGHSEL